MEKNTWNEENGGGWDYSNKQKKKMRAEQRKLEEAERKKQAREEKKRAAAIKAIESQPQTQPLETIEESSELCTESDSAALVEAPVLPNEEPKKVSKTWWWWWW